MSTAPDSALCFCDRQGIGVPGVSCGDCPTRDYKQVTTSAPRVAAHRARKAAAGLAEVRGIWAPPEYHDVIRLMVKVVTPGQLAYIIESQAIRVNT